MKITVTKVVCSSGREIKIERDGNVSSYFASAYDESKLEDYLKEIQRDSHNRPQ
jgi:hypothetical protein